MTELNAPLAATSDVLSLISGPQAPVVSTSESATTALNFSSVLTELMGTIGEPSVPAATVPPETIAVQEATAGVKTPGLVQPMIFVEEPTETSEPIETPETEETAEKKEIEIKEKPEQVVPGLVPVEPKVVVPGAIQEKQPVKRPQPVALHIASSMEEASVTALPQVQPQPQPTAKVSTQPEIEQAWADVRKFEFKVEHEAPQRALHQTHTDAAAASAEPASRQAMITTDPLVNLRQEKLLPRILLVDRAGIEARLPEGGKPALAAPALEHTAAPTTYFSDLIRTIDNVEQAIPARPVEIPDMPQLKVVRAVAMEVGNADSQVVIRIQERGGDLSLQLDAGSEGLRQDLQSSVESLVEALQQGDMNVSHVEISKKSPIEKVRRMKEAK